MADVTQDPDYNPYCVLPPEGKPGIGEKIMQLVMGGIEEKERLGKHELWARSYKYKRNRAFKVKSTTKRPLVPVNLWGERLDESVARICRSTPTYSVMPVGVEDMSGSEDKLARIQRLISYNWREREFQQVYRMAVADGECYNTTITKLVFDPNIGKDGDTDWLVIDPFRFIPYPYSTMDVEKAQAIFELKPTNIHTLRKQYPQFASQIQSDDDLLHEFDEDRETPIQDKALSSVKSALGRYFEYSERESGEECLVIECWVRDSTPGMPEMPQMLGPMAGNPMEAMGMPPMALPPSAMPGDNNSAMAVDGTEPTTSGPVDMQNSAYDKYPGNLRMIRICNGGKLILEDKPNPSINPGIPREIAANTYGWDKYPYIRTWSLSDTLDPWGRGDFETLGPIIAELNLAISKQAKELRESGGIIKKVPQHSGCTPDQIIEGGVSSLIPRDAMAAASITVEATPAVQSYADPYTEKLFRVLEMLSPRSQFQMMEVAGGGALAYKALQLLKEEIDMLGKQRYDNYVVMLREAGRRMFSLYQNWYTEARWYEYDDSGVEKREMIDLQGNSFEYLQFPIKLNIVKDSLLPDSQVEQWEMAGQLFDRGAFGPPGSPFAVNAYLQALQWPGRKEIVKNIEAGVVQPIMEKIAAAGAPEPLMEYLGQIVEMESPDMVSMATGEGQLPTLYEVVSQLIDAGELQPGHVEQMRNIDLQYAQLDLQAKQMELALQEQFYSQEKMLEMEKIKATVEKLMQEALSEEMKREVMEFGMWAGRETIQINKAQVVMKARGGQKPELKSSWKGVRGVKADNAEYLR